MRDHIIDSYINEIITEIYRVESLKSSDAKMYPILLALWIGVINESCERMYEEYLMGLRDHFYMSVEEYHQIFDEAGLLYAEKLLDEMVDDDRVIAEINKDGEILYKTNNS